jgi:AraC family transcriptional regulator, regulatory protein of adaptative response / methylated-DNA-[protein]-cysteine methyltransferase
MNTMPDLTKPLTESVSWQAVLDRDAAFDGQFVYAVRSTGVYCRPSCPSRRPRREQVAFFAAPAEARAAGFRPCRRCAPDQPLPPRVELVERACRLIEAADVAPTLEALGRALAVSPFHLQRVFKAATGLTPRQYAAGLRAGRFKAGLRAGQDVTTAMYEAGYQSAGRLYAEAPQRLGMNPSTYRSGGKTMQIQYSISDCLLGRLLVAATGRGVSAVYLGDEDAGLEAMLRQEYPAAELVRAAQPRPETAAVVDYLSGQNPGLALPLDVQATTFQLRVWEELRRIPYGQTRTYTQVASALGKPAAVRAVANACAANPAALVTPCHRVIRSDGGLGGYRWGIERKRQLLDGEQHAAA